MNKLESLLYKRQEILGQRQDILNREIAVIKKHGKKELILAELTGLTIVLCILTLGAIILLLLIS